MGRKPKNNTLINPGKVGKIEKRREQRAAMEGKERETEKTTEKLCKRCKQSYTASSNTSSSCRFHPSFFVCRRHDDQKRYPPISFSFYSPFFVFMIVSLYFNWPPIFILFLKFRGWFFIPFFLIWIIFHNFICYM